MDKATSERLTNTVRELRAENAALQLRLKGLLSRDADSPAVSSSAQEARLSLSPTQQALPSASLGRNPGDVV